MAVAIVLLPLKNGRLQSKASLEVNFTDINGKLGTLVQDSSQCFGGVDEHSLLSSTYLKQPFLSLLPPWCELIQGYKSHMDYCSSQHWFNLLFYLQLQKVLLQVKHKLKTQYFNVNVIPLKLYPFLYIYLSHICAKVPPHSSTHLRIYINMVGILGTFNANP